MNAPHQAVSLGAALLLIGCVPASVLKTPTVTGRVIDARTGRAVAGAKVGFPAPNSVWQITDRDGRFAIQSTNKLGIVVLLPFDPAQKYLPFVVGKAGFQSLRTEVPFYEFGRASTLALPLEPIR